MTGIYPYLPLFCLWIRSSIDYFILCHLKIIVSLLFTNRLLGRVNDFIVQAPAWFVGAPRRHRVPPPPPAVKFSAFWEGMAKTFTSIMSLMPSLFLCSALYWTDIKVYVLLLTALGWKGIAILNNINVFLLMLNEEGILDFSSLRSISFLQTIMNDGIIVRGRAQHWWCLITKAPLSAFWLAMWPHKWLVFVLLFNNLGYFNFTFALFYFVLF